MVGRRARAEGFSNDWSKFAGRASLHGNVDFATLGGYRSVPGAHRQTSALRSHGQPAALVCLTIQDTRHGALTPDLIHVKTLLLEMPDYPTLLQRLAILLRRGGLLVVIESEPMFVRTGRIDSIVDRQIPRCGGESSQALSIWNACVRDAYCARGGELLTLGMMRRAANHQWTSPFPGHSPHVSVPLGCCESALDCQTWQLLTSASTPRTPKKWAFPQQATYVVVSQPWLPRPKSSRHQNPFSPSRLV